MKVKINCKGENTIISIPSLITNNCTTLQNALQSINVQSDEYIHSSNNFTSKQIQNFIEYIENHHELIKTNSLAFYLKLRDFILVSDYLEYQIPNNFIYELETKFKINIDNNIKDNFNKLKSLDTFINNEIYTIGINEKLENAKKSLLNITKDYPSLNEKFKTLFEKDEQEISLYYDKKERIQEYESLYEIIFVEIFSSFNDDEVKELYKSEIDFALNDMLKPKKIEDKNIKKKESKEWEKWPSCKNLNQPTIYSNIENEPLKPTITINKFGNYYESYSNIIFNKENDQYIAIGVQEEDGKINKLTRRNILYLTRHKFRYDYDKADLLATHMNIYTDCKNKIEKKVIKDQLKLERKKLKNNKKEEVVRNIGKEEEEEVVIRNIGKEEEEEVRNIGKEEEDDPIIYNGKEEDIILYNFVKNPIKTGNDEVVIDNVDLDDLYYEIEEDFDDDENYEE